MTDQPEWRKLLSTDDEILWIDRTGRYAPEIEVWEYDGDDSPDDAEGRVYRFPLDRLDSEALAREWFADDLDAAALSAGRGPASLRAAFASEDARERWHAYSVIWGYHGIDNFDQYPSQSRRDVWEIWKAHGARINVPSIADVQSAIEAIDRTPPMPFQPTIDDEDTDCGDPCPADAECEVCNPSREYMDPDDSSLDVRLQVYPDGQWSIHTGDSQYDLDHRGAWGNTSIAFIGDPSGDDLDSAEVAQDLRSQVIEAACEAATMEREESIARGVCAFFRFATMAD